MKTCLGRVVLGLDLSLLGTGMVAIPEEWAFGRRRFGWKLLRFGHIGRPLHSDASIAEQIKRADEIARTVQHFATSCSVSHVFVEEYAFNQHGARARAIAELGGIVKHALIYGAGLKTITPVVASSARKLTYGKIPKGTDYKAMIKERLDRAGAPFETGDERDAFTIANYGLTEIDLPAMTIPSE